MASIKAERARIYSDCSSMVIMREKTDISSKNVCRLPVGTIVMAKKINLDWSQVQSDSNVGYIMNHFLVYGEVSK